ncbi:MAG: homoserine dehydrogenase [Anaerolineae bacterium]
MSQTIRVALVGLGHVGRGFLTLMLDKKDILASRFGLSIKLTAVADSSGAVLDARGIDPTLLLQHKLTHGGIGTFPYGGKPGLAAPDMVKRAKADLLLEASPVNMESGQPGLHCLRLALSQGWHAVLANKAPLVLAYQELSAAAAAQGKHLAFSATVCGALPVVNIGRRDHVAVRYAKIEGVLNSTSNYILTTMEAGKTYAEALREAQAEGVAEADPALDVDGWDTANKLTIIANSVLDFPCTITDVEVRGIRGIGPEDLRRARSQGEVIKLLAVALPLGAGYRLSVHPARLPLPHPLATVNGWEMGVVWHTDIMGVQFAKVDERGPIPTAAAMLRDVINISRG